MSQSQLIPVAPNSVRVWTGFRLPTLKQETFFEKLGSVFCPITVQMQARAGLTAYLPSVLPVEKPAAAPDEIALVFYREGETESQNTYHLAKTTVGGRAYSDLHALVFDLTRSLSGFPNRFSGNINADGRYYLFDESVDWQYGTVNVIVGVRTGTNQQEFLSHVASWLQRVQNHGGPDGAIAATSPDYVAYWEHWSVEAKAKDSRIRELAELAETVYDQRIPPHPLPEDLWAPYDGVQITGGESFNFQFERDEPPF